MVHEVLILADLHIKFEDGLNKLRPIHPPFMAV